MGFVGDTTTPYHVWPPSQPGDMRVIREDEPELAAESFAETACRGLDLYVQGPTDQVPVRYEVKRVVDVTYVATRKDTP